MRIYLSGPMRGLPDDNFPAFNEAAALLRADGHFVFNPAESPPEINNNIRRCFEVDTYYLCTSAELVVLLPGWQQSKGALAEKALAEAMNIPWIEYADYIAHW